MKLCTMILSILVVAVILSCQPQAPKFVYEDGLAASSGYVEKGVAGREDIDFYYPTNYYKVRYDLKASFPHEKVPAFMVEKVLVNGRQVSDFVVFNHQVYTRFNKANGKDNLVVATLANWQYDQEYEVQVLGMSFEGKQVVLSVRATSPKRDILFLLPDDKCEQKYFTAELAETTAIGTVQINGLPVKNFDMEKTNGVTRILVPYNWRSGEILNVKLVGKDGTPSTSFKALAPRFEMSFGYPSPSFAHYFLSYTFSHDLFDAFTVDKIAINDVEVRDFQISDDGESAYDLKLTGKNDMRVTARCNWEPDNEYHLKIDGTTENKTPVVLKATGHSGNSAGYWNKDWPYYASVVITENAGVRRVNEPVHLFLGLFADRITDPGCEIRVVEYDPYYQGEGAPYREIPCQVYNVSTWDDKNLIEHIERDAETGKQVLRYSATVNLEVAFLADVYPYSSKVYLIFYGNPKAPEPKYASKLKVSGEGLGQTVENDFYRIVLDEKSGQLFSVFVKQGLDIMLEHKLETNGAVHWNPGSYSPPHAWVHASDWENPEMEQITGPIFHQTRRYAPLPHLPHMPTMVTYTFYADQPYVLVSTMLEVTEDCHVKALRNGEIVFNHEVLDEFVYKSPRGNVKSMPIEGSRPHPGHAIHVPADTPWLGFVSREKKIGFAGILLDYTNANKFGGFPRAEQPYIYVANGPWIYWSRALVYSFGSNNPSRMMEVKKGGIYYDKTAYLPFKLGDTQAEAFTMVESYAKPLNAPLNVEVVMDTDPRNSKEWIVPILVEPFDEGVKGAIGGHK